MRVLQIARRFVQHDWGGTETVVVETSKRLLERGWQTEILCPNALADSQNDTIDGVRVRRFGYFYPYLGLSQDAVGRLDKKAGNLFSFSLMQQLKRETPLDLLHVHTGKRLGGIVRHVARQRHIPYVVSLHGGVFDVPAEEAEHWVEPTRGALEWGKLLGWWVGSRRVLDDAAAILCVGRREHDAVRSQFPHKNVVHLPNGVDVNRFRVGDGMSFRSKFGIPQDAGLLLCVGRLDHQKNQKQLIQCLPTWLETHANLHLVLVGHVTDSAYEKQLNQQIEQLGLRQCVTIVPGIDPSSSDLVNAYHAADVFVLPSRHEPFGIVVVEAWAAGVPVVASRVGGLADLVRHGQDGLLFHVNDDLACSRAVTEMLSMDETQRHALTRQARRRAEDEFSWEHVTSQLTEIYREVCRDSLCTC